MYRSKIPSVVKAASVAAAAATGTPAASASDTNTKQDKQESATPPTVKQPAAAHAPHHMHSGYRHFNQPSANAPPISQAPTQSTSTSPTVRATLEYAKSLAYQPRPSVASVTAQNMALRAVKSIPYKHEDDINKAKSASSSSHLQTDINKRTASACIIPLTVDLFDALLTCPKRFVLERYLSRSDSPTLNEGDRMLMEDGAQFAQLCRQKYTLSSSSMGGQSIYRLTNPSFENALEETAKILEYYFGTYLPKQDIQMCEPMTMFMPAFNALVDPAEFTRLASHSSVSDTMKELRAAAVGTDNLKDQQVLFELRTRINVLQYFPSSNKWIAHASQASTELKSKDMDLLFRKQLFQLYTLRHCADNASRAYTQRSESGNPSSEPQRIGSMSFSSSFHGLRKTAPSFVASLNDVSISVGGAASTNGGAIGGTATAHDDHSSSSSAAQSIRQKNAAAAGCGVTATVNTLHSRMVPIGEDCNSPRTLATMICSTPASVLRGHFLEGNLSVTSLREELAMIERTALAEEEGEAEEAGDGGAKPRKKRPANNRALSEGVSPKLASLLSHVPVVANLTTASAVVEAAETTSDPIGKEIERLQRHQRQQRAMLAPQIAQAEAIAATLSDPEHLEFPFVLPTGSEFMSDMGLGDVLFSHCGRIIREIGIVGAYDDGNTTQLEKVFATATPRDSLTSAYNEIRRGGTQKQPPKETPPDLSMACYRDACTNCQFFKAGYCRRDGPSSSDLASPATTTESQEFVLTLPGARTWLKKSLYRGNVRTAKDVLKKLPTLPLPTFEGTSCSQATSNSESTALATTVEEEEELCAAVNQLSDKQKMYAYCCAHGLVAINLAHIRRWLLSVRYPLIAIDFEAASFALPRFGKLKPYGHLPFQFSSLSYATDPFASEWAASLFEGCGGDDVSPPQIISTADGAMKGKKKIKSPGKEKSPKATVTTSSSYDPFPPTAYFASHLTKLPEPVVKMSYCYVGSDCDPREDPRRRVADALATMIVRSREAQKRFNAECAASSKSNPAASTHAFFIASALNGGVAGAKAKPQKLIPIAPPISSSGRVEKGKRKTSEETSKSASSTTIAVDIAPVRGSHNRYRAAHLLTDGLHSTISKATNLTLTVDDPTAHGTLLGHSVAFERLSFASVSLLVREGSTGYEPKPKAADLFDSLVFMDSLRLATDGIIHPLTMGSNSLKKLVPALVPTKGTQYSDLDISDGQTAAAVFRDWITTMTQKLPLQSVHDSAVAVSKTPSPASSTDHRDGSGHPVTRRDYEHHAQRVAAFKETFDKKRDELVAYCNTDTEQMVAVVREVSRIGRLAEMLKARGNGAERLLLPVSKKKCNTQNESAGGESSTLDSPCPLRTPSGETLPTFWVDFDNGWVGVPLKTVIGTRDH